MWRSCKNAYTTGQSRQLAALLQPMHYCISRGCKCIDCSAKNSIIYSFKAILLVNNDRIELNMKYRSKHR